MHLTCILRIKVYLKLTCLPSWTHLILTGLCYALGLRHSAKSRALSPLLLFHALFLSPHLCLQCCLYNLLEGQPENSWPLGEKCCIISNLSRYSGLHLPCFLQHVQQYAIQVLNFLAEMGYNVSHAKAQVVKKKVTYLGVQITHRSRRLSSD